MPGKKNSKTKLDTAYEKNVRDSFRRQGFMQHLGAKMTNLRPGCCEIRARFSEKLTRQHGYFHAGVTGAIADSASGYAAYTLMPEGNTVLTVEYKLNLVAPARGEWLVARARVLRAGRTLTVCAADVFGVTRGVETLCATSLSTIMALPGKPDGPPKRK